MDDPQAPLPAAETYSASDLARWGLLEPVRRELIRDRLMTAIAEPSPAVLAVLRQQSHADEAALVRRWRWQQWCQQHGTAKVASHFLARKAGLDQVSFWRLISGDSDLVSELYQQLREGESSFEQLAHQAQVALIGPVQMAQLPADLAALLRISEVGVLWPPRQQPDGSWQVLRLETRFPAVLDESLRHQLLAELGEQVLTIELAAAFSAVDSGGIPMSPDSGSTTID